MIHGRVLRAAGVLVPALALWISPASPSAHEADPPPAPAAATEEEAPWQLPKEMLEALAREADLYRDYALRFTCAEEARIAHYDSSNEASRESVQRYAYLLERDADGQTLREVREVLKKRQKGGARDAAYETTGKEAENAERFPPAYAWVFLFSRFHQPFFMYRSLGDRFEGFDWVHEIQFRGALPFTDGKDIREWEGTVLVDVVTLTPLEVRAEPTAQKERIRAQFSQWSQAFNLLGFRLAPRPFGYRCRVAFGLRRERLSFPTELRYETFRAVGPKQFVPWMASVREYADYRFFKTSTTETTGGPAGP